MSIIEINNQKVLIIDSSIKHSEKCKCKNCRTYKFPPKAKLALPLDIKPYIPVFVINPFISFIFISKIYDIIESKYLDVNFEAIESSLHNSLIDFINTNFSKEFVDCINLLARRDIFNAIGYFEENINTFNEFEMFYLSGLINFYLQNYEKSYESLNQAFKILFNIDIENLKEDLIYVSNDVFLFIVFDLAVTSIFLKKYSVFQKLLAILINTETKFSFYSFMLFIFLLYYVYDTYIIFENIELIKTNIEKLLLSLNYFAKPEKIKSYILFLFMCLAIYRSEIFDVLKSEINEISCKINPSINSIDNYINTLKTCNVLDKDNLLYKIALYLVDKNSYREIVFNAEFLPLNKTISNFIDYVKFLEPVISKLVFLEKETKLNFSKLRGLVESEPNNPFYWFINGLYSFSNREFDTANNYFRGAIATDNKFTEARIFFALTSFLTGDIEKSQKILENSLNTSNSFLYDIILLNLAVIYKLQEKTEFLENIFKEITNSEIIDLANKIIINNN